MSSTSTERMRRQKLTLSQAIHIRALGRDGCKECGRPYRNSELAEMFNVSRGNITHIMKRLTHKVKLQKRDSAQRTEE